MRRKNLALHQPADQSQPQPMVDGQDPPAARLPDCRLYRARPQAGRRTCSSAAWMSLRTWSRSIEADERLRALASGDAPEAERRRVYLETRWAVRQLVFANPLLDFDQLLFVKRFTQETYPGRLPEPHAVGIAARRRSVCPAPHRAIGGSLFRAVADPPRTRRSRPLGRDLPAERRARAGPCPRHGLVVGRRRASCSAMPWPAATSRPRAGSIARRATACAAREEPTHIFEIGVDGSGLRQLTAGEWSDLDPTYAPNGDIVFVSERCGTSLQCNEYDKDETSCNLYVMRPDGSGIRRLSVNKDGDYLPHTLDNGLIAYTRWEYHERSWAFIQSIWTVRPDGTGADAIFKQHFVNPWALEDTRSIPGSAKLVAIAAGHHTLAAGPLVDRGHRRGHQRPAGHRHRHAGRHAARGRHGRRARARRRRAGQRRLLLDTLAAFGEVFPGFLHARRQDHGSDRLRALPGRRVRQQGADLSRSGHLLLRSRCRCARGPLRRCCPRRSIWRPTTPPVW